MPILEKISQPLQARHWTDSIPLEYHYTAGVAGEAFRRELKENGRFLSSKCAQCKSTYIPARMFCPACFIEIKDNAPLEETGYVYSHTTVNRNRTGESIRKLLRAYADSSHRSNKSLPERNESRAIETTKTLQLRFREQNMQD